MSEVGRYHPSAPVRTYPLPPRWAPVEQAILDAAADKASSAFEGMRDRAEAYYNPDGDYAGNLLTWIPSASREDIDVSDLFAATTLNVKIHPRAARTLLDPHSAHRDTIRHSLRAIPHDLHITALDAEANHQGEVLAALQSLYRALSTARTGDANAWVFASKVCARKRPYMAPVRDNVVCELLNGGRLRGGIGTFETDLQVFAYLMSHPDIHHPLSELRAKLEAEHPHRLEDSDLRLLDVVLWTYAMAQRRHAESSN